MKIGIPTFGCDGGKSGISRYLIDLLRAMPEAAPGLTAELLLYPEERSVFMPPHTWVEAVPIHRRFRHPVADIAWFQARLPAFCRGRGHSVLFLPAANRRLPARCPVPTVGAFHDFSSIHMEGKYDPARHFYITRVLPWLARRLDHVISPSECTRRDLIDFARVPPERITVIPNGLNHAVFHPGDADAARARLAAKHRVRPPYILYIARIEHPGKNHVRLIRAFSRVKTRTGLPHTLVLAGSDWSRAEEVHAEAAASPHAADIQFTGFVPGGDLTDFYTGAEVFVFPSLFEGFGLPLLEAMATGIPVACADCSSLPEIAGDSALLFDPTDEEAMSSAIERLLTDAALRAQCAARGLERARGYTWAEAARQTLDVIRKTAG